MKLEGMTGLMPQLCRDLTPAKPLATGLSIYRTPSDDDPNTWAGRMMVFVCAARSTANKVGWTGAQLSGEYVRRQFALH